MLGWLGIDLSGFGSEGAVVNALVEALLIVFLIWKFFLEPKLRLKKGKDRRKPVNPDGGPGKAEECLKHMKKLTGIETEINNIKDDITEIKKNSREDHKEIFRKIDAIKNKRR